MYGDMGYHLTIHFQLKDIQLLSIDINNLK